jgi:hypothetical protein
MKRHTSMRRWIAAASLCLCMGLPTAATGIPSYRVSVDTSGFVGKHGFIDLQFNPAIDSPGATAVVSDFSTTATLVGSPETHGAVSGTLPGTQTFANGPSPFNASLQQVIFGSEISFLLSFSGAFETASTGDGTAFALGILGLGYETLLGDPDIGAALVFDLVPGAAPSFTAYDPTVSVSVIPEPSVDALIVVGLLAIAFGWTGRRHANSCETGPLHA